MSEMGPNDVVRVSVRLTTGNDQNVTGALAPTGQELHLVAAHVGWSDLGATLEVAGTRKFDFAGLAAASGSTVLPPVPRDRPAWLVLAPGEQLRADVPGANATINLVFVSIPVGSDG